MRVVLLTAHSTHGEIQHRYVASKLADEFRDELVAIIVASANRRGFQEKVRRWKRRYTLAQLISRALARTYRFVIRADVRRQRIFRSVLFSDGESGEMPRPDLIHLVRSHNSADCIALLERINADIVIVYGTLIIGKKVIAVSKRIINLHTGFSPIYRGSDTIFWPLHNGEPHNVGVTVHRLDPGIDSGPILARGKPSIEPGDDEDRLFAKALKLGTELLCRSARREVEGSAHPIVQDLDLGREYRSVDRTLAAELRTRRLLSNSLLSEARSAWSEEF